MESRCWPIRRTISWSVWPIRGPGGESSPLRAPAGAASPLSCGAPLAHGWCMAGGDSLRDLLRGGWCPAPSSPESVEARLVSADGRSRSRRRALVARSAPITTSPPTSTSSASAPSPRHTLPRLRDVSVDYTTSTITNRTFLFVCDIALRLLNLFWPRTTVKKANWY